MDASQENNIQVSKKDIIDYLRNKQKAYEIDAKVNGINIWVLLGAMAIVSWKFIEIFNYNIIGNYEITLRSIVLSQAIVYIIIFCLTKNSVSTDVRYVDRGIYNLNLPFLFIVRCFLDMIPVFLILIYCKVTAEIFAMTLLESISVFYLIRNTISAFYANKKKKRFPEPEFELTPWIRVLTNSFIFFCLSWIAFRQFSFLKENLHMLSADFVKNLVLLLALFWIVILSVNKIQKNSGIEWTYELETNLLVNIVTPEAALRRIEHRALGQRLQDVMDGFFEEMEKKLSDLVLAVEKCQDELKDLDVIPEKYSAGRSACIKQASDGPKAMIKDLNSGMLEFFKYLKRIKNKKESADHPGVVAAINDLVDRGVELHSRIEVVDKKFNDWLTAYQPF